MRGNFAFDTLFLDRDGVINLKIDQGYVLSCGNIVILPGIMDFLEWARKTFNNIVVLTNQRCVGRGLLSVEGLKEINDRINVLIGNPIQEFVVCPHLAEDNCNCRKPKDGMFRYAIEKYQVDVKHSWMIGDSESDLLPAKLLGLNTIFISGQESAYADSHIASPAELTSLFTKIQSSC